MLVLSRKPQEKIVIAEEIVVTVLSIRGNRVQIGITAPREIPVHRAEVMNEHRAVRDDSRPALHTLGAEHFAH